MDNTTRGPAGEREQQAKRLYVTMTDNDPIVHSNRFPSWEELSQIDRDVWIAKVPVTPVASHLPESGPKTGIVKLLEAVAEHVEHDPDDKEQFRCDERGDCWNCRAADQLREHIGTLTHALPSSERDEAGLLTDSELLAVRNLIRSFIATDESDPDLPHLRSALTKLSVPEHRTTTETGQ